MSRPLLVVEGLTVRYGAVAAVDSVSLRVAQGSVVCLIGANGAGKTTTLRAVSGLAPVAAGRIEFDGRDITRTPAHLRTALGLAHSPEGRGVFAELSVAENLKLGAWTAPGRAAQREGMERAYALFPRLRERAGQAAGTLSGGEQQMLALARALMARPRLLMLDEPSLGLAPQVVDTIFETVARVSREGVTVLLVEQNAHQALRISTHAYVLETGRLLLSGAAAEVAKDPRVREAYLGETV